MVYVVAIVQPPKPFATTSCGLLGISDEDVVSMRGSWHPLHVDADRAEHVDRPVPAKNRHVREG